MNMKCQRCQNEDPRFFYQDHGVYYCRKCISFSRLDVGEQVRPCQLRRRILSVRPTLQYELTSAQKKASDQVVCFLKQGFDVFVYAATGAGKTEMTFASICFYLSQGKKVCFSISRRQVVLEIAQRLRVAFPQLEIVEVTQGYTQKIDGDIIVCTMHQLYRYPYGFDLLIMDEIDAYPYVENPLLKAIAKQACIGQRLCLSATPDQESQTLIEQGKMKVVTLFQRPHKQPLVVPKVIQCSSLYQLVYIFYFCFRQVQKQKQVLLYVPRRFDCIWMHGLLYPFFKVSSIHSKTKDKDEIMKAFREHQYDILVCTTLLERGITVGSVQVIVYQGQHIVFTSASLIQIFGRVGRTFQDPKGEGVCLCQYASKSIKECVKQIQWMNDSVGSVKKT